MTIDPPLAAIPARRRATAALLLATAMQAFDATIANVALPQLERSFGGGIDLGSWVMTSYLCAAAVSAILTAWLRRRWGARRLVIVAAGLFVAASLSCALANTSTTLIIFRLVQGAAAGIIQPLAQAIILDLYPPEQHGRMLAIWGATIMAGPMLGPLLGGAITDAASWRWIFGLNAPLGAVAIIGLRALPRAAPAPANGRVDVLTLSLLATATAALQYALQRSIGRLWPPAPEAVAALAAAAVAGLLVARRGVRRRDMVLGFEVYSDLNFTLASIYNFLVGASLFTTIVFIPALVEGPLAWTATRAGLVIAPRGLGTMAMMLAVRHLIDRVDHRVLLSLGLVITGFALALMAHLPASPGVPLWLAATSAGQGIGVGLLFTPLSTMAFSTLAAELRTDGSGIYNLARQLGCATGVAVMTAFLQLRILARVAETAPNLVGIGRAIPSATAVLAAYADCFRLLALLTVAMIPSVLLFRIRPRAPAGSAERERCGKA
jgi:DHA2 family multidrug resistance protein